MPRRLPAVGHGEGLPEGASRRRRSRRRFSGGHTTNWSYRGGELRQRRTPTPPQGDEFPADTVLVLRVQVGDAGYLDPAGNPVPETKFTGKGQAMLFHDGRLVRGTWTKYEPDRAGQLLDQGRQAEGAGRAHLDRAGPRQRRAADVTFRG